MRTEELDFDLPPELIAQEPLADRASSRLLHYHRGERAISHRHFIDLPEILQPGDLRVFNDTRVLPARFGLRKETGGAVEGLFIAESCDAGSKFRAISSAYRVASVCSSASDTAGQSPPGIDDMTSPSTSVRMSQRRSLRRLGARALNRGSM